MLWMYILLALVATSKCVLPPRFQSQRAKLRQAQDPTRQHPMEHTKFTEKPPRFARQEQQVEFKEKPPHHSHQKQHSKLREIPPRFAKKKQPSELKNKPPRYSDQRPLHRPDVNLPPYPVWTRQRPEVGGYQPHVPEQKESRQMSKAPERYSHQRHRRASTAKIPAPLEWIAPDPNTCPPTCIRGKQPGDICGGSSHCRCGINIHSSGSAKLLTCSKQLPNSRI
uniref:Putative secreted protein n=1 Tax=Amblyomma triste TaxID=251400 RepID=A0A023G3A1_AMBTT